MREVLLLSNLGLVLICWFAAGTEGQLPSGVELQSRVREHQLSVLIRNSGRGRNVRKQARIKAMRSYYPHLE